MVTVIELLDVTTKRGGTAKLDPGNDAPLCRGQRRTMTLQKGLTVAAEDVHHFEPEPAHRTGPRRSREVTHLRSVWGANDRAKSAHGTRLHVLGSAHPRRVHYPGSVTDLMCSSLAVEAGQASSARPSAIDLSRRNAQPTLARRFPLLFPFPFEHFKLGHAPLQTFDTRRHRLLLRTIGSLAGFSH